MQLTKAQAEIALDPHRFRVLCCGRRFGKTTLAIDQIKGRASIPNSRIAYVAPTYQQSRDIAWAQLKNDCKQAAETINESRLEIKLVNGSLIQLKGWEAIETLRGQHFDLIVLDEVAMFRNFWLQWQEVIRPTLTDTKGEALFISTPKGFNHFYDLFNLQEEDSDFKSFHFSTYDNSHIPPEEIDKARLELSADRFAQEYMADFRKTEGLVYKEFDREKHIYTDDKPVVGELILGIDFGFTNPCAVLSIKKTSSDDLYVVQEFYERGKTDNQVAEYVAGLRAVRVYPDPAAAAAIQELKDHKVNVRDVVKGKDSIKNGIDNVREYFKAGKLHIHISCKNLILELETYSYPDRKPGHNEYEEPIDENNHALDALRYVISMLKSATPVKANQYYPTLNRTAPSQMARNPQSTNRQYFPTQRGGKINPKTY